jgi:hypothetical protein
MRKVRVIGFSSQGGRENGELEDPIMRVLLLGANDSAANSLDESF